MTEEKHTAGPWVVDGVGIRAIVRGADMTIVATRHRLPAEIHEANVRLIASAPEMAAELRKMMRAYVSLLEIGRDRIISLGGDCDPVDVMEENDTALRSARALISRATGEA